MKKNTPNHRMHHQKPFLFFTLIFIISLLSILGIAWTNHEPISQIQLEDNEIQDSPTNTPEPEKENSYSIWFDPRFPEKGRDLIVLSSSITTSPTAAEADFLFKPGENPQNEITWVYALVAPFPTITDNITKEQLITFWKEGTIDADFPLTSILVDDLTASLFKDVWGIPSSSVKIIADDALGDEAWKNPQTWAIIPFDKIEPSWKVLTIDDNSPIRKDFNGDAYPLSITFSLNGQTTRANEFMHDAEFGDEFSIREPGNRMASKMTTVILTGVTALVRGTADLMERKGMDYPGLDIRQWTREADILHINNEVPFDAKCPKPFSQGNDVLVFCSRASYIDLLTDIGTDIVDLSGDHFQDWGSEAMLYTVDLYHEKGLKTYGGGKNLDEGKKPLLIDHNGNRLSFFGCNAKAPGYAVASATNPGAVFCDFNWLTNAISEQKDEGRLPIMTFQHREYYAYTINPILQADFRKVADAGAVIVSGNQAHQPHGMELYNQSFLHYGLGNLFFDQYKVGLPQRQAFLDRHVIYDNHYISTELLTIMFIDFARPRPMTADERKDLLQTVFQASGWNNNPK